MRCVVPLRIHKPIISKYHFACVLWIYCPAKPAIYWCRFPIATTGILLKFSSNFRAVCVCVEDWRWADAHRTHWQQTPKMYTQAAGNQYTQIIQSLHKYRNRKNEKTKNQMRNVTRFIWLNYVFSSDGAWSIGAWCMEEVIVHRYHRYNILCACEEYIADGNRTKYNQK